MEKMDEKLVRVSEARGPFSLHVSSSPHKKKIFFLGRRLGEGERLLKSQAMFLPSVFSNSKDKMVTNEGFAGFLNVS